jgi:hypothetical protein
LRVAFYLPLLLLARARLWGTWLAKNLISHSRGGREPRGISGFLLLWYRLESRKRLLFRRPVWTTEI